jgi:hypothetical protein
MNRLFRVLVILCSILFIGAGVASADTLQFTLVGPVSASFELSSAPSVMSGNADPGFGFTITPASLMVNGAAAPGDFLAFYNGAFGGGLGIFASAFDMVAYPFRTQIYGGTESNPTFAPGVFTLNDGVPITPVPGAYTLTITDLTTVSTPEPSVTVLLSIGLLAIGLAVLRYKRGFAITAG